MEDGGAKIEDLSWRQGSLIPDELIQQTRSIGSGIAGSPAEGSFHIVVTQSCDLVNKSLEDEPWCEVMKLRAIPKTESLRENGRNPRFLHFYIEQQGITTPCEVAAKDRLFLPRKILATVPPLTTVEVSEQELKSLTDWISQRYSRPALPSAFNRRLRPQGKSLKRLVEKGHHLFRDFFLRISSFGELADDKPYLLKLLLVAHQEAFDSDAAAVRTFAADLEKMLKSCAGIEVVDVKIQTDTETSLRAVDDYLPWDDFDYLTDRDAE
jgi:hypothetical protein